MKKIVLTAITAATALSFHAFAQDAAQEAAAPAAETTAAAAEGPAAQPATQKPAQPAQKAPETPIHDGNVIYISPNNDGVQDYLEVPLRIKDKRYIKDWSFIISNEQGDVVRTIGNKEKRPTRITFKSFFKALFAKKSGVTIPKSIVWNGAMDNADIAPDGTYYYSFSASDDNGNTATTERFAVIVDNTPPEIDLQQPTQDNKIFGEGAKTLFSVKQDGSSEDEWTGVFTDAAGNVVRTYKWTQSAPVSFDWGGTDDNGAPLSDGVYSYKITATDRAGNKSEVATISNIIYSAEKPATNITINGSRYFSPDGNGVNDTVKFDVRIPLPDPVSGNKLTNWAVTILSKDGKAVKTYSGEANPPDSIEFDGKDDKGAIAADGVYQARVTAKYLNGFEPDPVTSPQFTLDVVAPTAKLGKDTETFGGGDRTTLTITQEIAAETGAPVQNWKGTIAAKDGTVVREFNFGEFPPDSVTWDGLDASNAVASSGEYTYTLAATDAAGNNAKVTPVSFVLDTSETELMLTAMPRAFNPAGDSAHNTMRLTPVVNGGSTVNHYVMQITDADDNVVYEVEENRALPKNFTWNGLSNQGDNNGVRCADGEYRANIITQAANGAEAGAHSLPFIIDTVPPKIDVSVPYTLFSPDATSKKPLLPVTAESSSEDKWTGSIQDAKGNVVKSYTWQGTVPSFNWDGTDDAGNKVADGTYKLVFASEDVAGNKAALEIGNITIDSREVKAYVSTELDAFSPNADGFKDTQKFAIRTTVPDGIESWSFDITSAEGTVVRSWSSAESPNVPASVTWDGLDKDGKVAEGVFVSKLNIVYAKGNTVDVASSSFICSVTPPQLSVKTATETGSGYFSPDNDGEDDDLFILLRGDSLVGLKNWSFQINDPNNGKKFWGTGGKSAITERMIWDGRGDGGELVQSATDYPYVFTATDELGMSSTVEGLISVDILVIRVGDVLKMAVPSIIFRQDAADFGIQEVDASGKVKKPGITKEQADNNERVLKRIAQVLNKFKNYTVTVEGHANSITGLEEEETGTKYGMPLVPLSKSRAEFVMAKLKKYGVSGNRLSAVGKGGREPVAQRGDKENAWKNRRVEFILNK